MKAGSRLLVLMLLPLGLTACVSNPGYGYAPAPYVSATYYGSAGYGTYGGYYGPYPRPVYGYYGYGAMRPAPVMYPSYPVVRGGPAIGIRYDFDGGRRGWGGRGWGHGGGGFRHR